MNKNRIVYTGPFDPTLCDGVSSAMYDLLIFLKQRGHDVFIITFMHENYATRTFIEREIDHINAEIITRNKNQCNFILNGINLIYEILPYTRGQVMGGHPITRKNYTNRINEYKDSCFFTVDTDFTSFTAHLLTETAPAHFIHSPNITINAFESSPRLTKLLRKRRVFVVSKISQRELKRTLDVDALVWQPFINPKRFQINNRDECNGNRIGYYSAGPHKGDDLVWQLICRMPECHFFIMGRNCSIDHKQDNVTYLGKVITIKDFYKDISLLLVPSTIPEGYPRVILEAAFNGIPTIVNKIGGTPEALGNSGILIDMAPSAEEMVQKYMSAINEILTHLDAYKTSALNRAKEYTKEIYRKSVLYDRRFLSNQH